MIISLRFYGHFFSLCCHVVSLCSRFESLSGHFWDVHLFSSLCFLSCGHVVSLLDHFLCFCGCSVSLYGHFAFLSVNLCDDFVSF